MKSLVQISAQYYENYNFENGGTPTWKPKGEQVFTLRADTDLFFYPQQRIARNIIDANIFWYKMNKPNANVCYSGIKNCLKFANYIEPHMIRKFYEY
jgi:hypothetical protein